MRRRKAVPQDGYPPQLDVFDVNDWWVTDPEDPTQLGYARIRWHVAREVYAEGGPWQDYLEPPVWWRHMDGEGS